MTTQRIRVQIQPYQLLGQDFKAEEKQELALCDKGCGNKADLIYRPADHYEAGLTCVRENTTCQMSLNCTETLEKYVLLISHLLEAPTSLLAQRKK